MGVIRRVGRRVLDRVAERVARDDLFEKPGERSHQPPLESTVQAVAAEQARLPGPVVVHHWATWCEPCEQELPLVRALAERVQVPVVGVSWDRFQDDGPMEQTLSRVEAMAGGLRTLVLTDGPERSFELLELSLHTVPQTLVYDARGKLLRHVAGPMESADVDAIAALL